MFQLMYASTAAWTMDRGDLNDILDVSRANNRRLGVTGLLLHLDHGFLQVLEGPKDAVLAVFDQIDRDHRHIGVRILIQQEVPERLFGEWSMGFDRWTEGAPRTANVFETIREAIEQTIPPEKAVALAAMLRNFYKVHADSCAA
jgi:hypothetical protein